MKIKDEIIKDIINSNDNDNNNNNISNINNSTSYQEINILNKKNNQNEINTLNNNNQANVNINILNDEKAKLKSNNKCLNTNNFRNIGRNIVLFNKFVFGPKNFLWLLILIMGGIAISYYIYLWCLGNFYSKEIYFILHICFFLTEFFMLISFLTEPGIIPRKSPEFMIKEEEKSEENEKKNENDINKKKEINLEATPRIFTERKCETCKILRPPGASHCRICDNCVLDFDHHCAYISNCVGKRNHKYFYLFLIFGSFFSILAMILNLIVIIYVLLIKAKETLIPMYKGNKWILFLSIFLFIISITFSTGRFPNWNFIITTGFSGFGLLCIIWYKYIPRNNTTPSYYNPFIIVVFIIAITFGIFVITNFIGQSFHISLGFTIKQSHSINEKIADLLIKNSLQKINPKYTRRLNCKERMNNIFIFLLTKVEKSLIIPERDLVINKI